MPISDLIARHGNAFQSSYLRSEANRRAEESFGLRQQMQQQTFQQNELKMQAQRQQQEQAAQVNQVLSDYTGDKRSLVDELIQAGDPRKAAQVIQAESALQGMDQRKRKEATDRMNQAQDDSIAMSDSILQAFNADPTGRQGMLAAINQREKLVQQEPRMAESLPDFRTMRPDQVQAWVSAERNKSLAIRKFDETQAHHRAIEKQALERTLVAKEKAEKKGYKFTKSDRQMELAAKISKQEASKQELAEFDLLNRTDPIEQLKRQILNRTQTKTEPEKITVGDIEYEVVEKLEDGRVRIRDKDGRTGIIKQ